MFDIETFIIHIYLSILEFLLIYYLFSRYDDKSPRINKNKLNIIVILITFVQAFFSSFEYFIINVTVSAILYFIVSFLFFKKWQDILFGWVIATAIIDIGEGIATMSLTTTSLSSKQIELLLSNSINTVIVFTFARLISLILIIFILRFRQIKDNKINLPTIYWLTFLFIIMKDILWTMIIANSLEKISFFYWAAVIPLLPISYILFYYTRRAIEKMIKTQVDSKVLDEKNKYYEQQLITIKQTLQAQKSVRHDLKNKLTPLLYLAQEGKKKELISQIQQLGNMSVLGKTFSDSGNITIDYIINLKLQSISNRNVKISCNVHLPIDIDILPFDLSSILGNLIDNAIEAQEYVEANKFITINIGYQVGIMIIEITNSYDGTIRSKKGEIISRKKDNENHGFGLSSVKEIAAEYNGELVVHHDNNKFKVIVKLIS